ncbi:MAG: hypothetical protein ACI9ON_004012 [Limisphaerales bacterium]
MFQKLVKEPLAYFALVGAVLYAVSSGTETFLDEEIVVDHAALLNFVRLQSRDFTPLHAEQRLSQADESTRDDLIREYVREEALSQEARRLGFADDDYVIRRRLVQRIEQMAEGLAISAVQVDDDLLREFYSANAANYALPKQITFTHVFFPQGAGDLEAAQSALGLLREQSVPFAQAHRFGERFLYHLNYVDRGEAFIASHFGQDFAQAVFHLEADQDAWYGPLASSYGQHLVKIIRYQGGYQPDFADVKSQVAAEYRREQIALLSEQAIAEIVNRYPVRLELEEFNMGSP